ncbi:MAG: DUF7557 family protein [Promethearchaeota archaeon]
MKTNTTIQIRKKTVQLLKSNKIYPRETYDEIIQRLLKKNSNTTSQNQYDAFLHKIQQLKMRELWDNDEDEAWEQY